MSAQTTKGFRWKRWDFLLPLFLGVVCLGLHIYSECVAVPWLQKTFTYAALDMPYTDILIFYPTLLFCTAYLAVYLGLWFLGRRIVRLEVKSKRERRISAVLPLLCVVPFAVCCLAMYLYIGSKVPFASKMTWLYALVYKYRRLAVIPGAILGGIMGYRHMGSADAPCPDEPEDPSCLPTE